MITIAVILFPGINTEYETRREINKAGMKGEFFRWNDDPKKLKKYDGYVIGGGFSYEDRGRAGIISALDTLLETLKVETKKGKPLLGICNGCQVLVEAGLAPDSEKNTLCFGMARNKRVSDGEVLGTGYYNDWVSLRNVAPKGRTAFTRNIGEGESFSCPVAHAEGRFVTRIPQLLDKLIKNKQVIFRYCDGEGKVSADFPINPNGSIWNVAGISNPEGNILALMPHVERSEESQTFFISMREYIEEDKKKWEKAKKLTVALPNNLSTPPKGRYAPNSQSYQLLVDLNITDNSADTFQNTLERMGFDGLQVRRQSHYEICYKSLRSNEAVRKSAVKAIQSGILVNTAKETPTIIHKKDHLTYSHNSRRFVQPNEITESTIALLVRDRDDFGGMAKTQSLTKRLGMKEVTDVKMGTIWHLTFPNTSKTAVEKMLKQLMKTRIFANPHIQTVSLYGNL